MNQDLLSKDDLLSMGWTARQVEAALDEPDEVGPSGHWYNSNGKPYYLRDRVPHDLFEEHSTRFLC